LKLARLRAGGLTVKSCGKVLVDLRGNVHRDWKTKSVARIAFADVGISFFDSRLCRELIIFSHR
jgi:hypothetical protein